MTTPTRRAWFARCGLVVVLSFTLSAAAASGAAAASRPCGEQRGDCDTGCPPTCAGGGCARVCQAVLGEAPKWIAPPTPERWVPDELPPPAPPPLDGVFHPPIA